MGSSNYTHNTVCSSISNGRLINRAVGGIMDKIKTDADEIPVRYTNIVYHGVCDTYHFCGMVLTGDCLYMPLYNGVEHNKTLSMRTLEAIVRDGD